MIEADKQIILDNFIDIINYEKNGGCDNKIAIVSVYTCRVVFVSTLYYTCTNSGGNICIEKRE
jgi:hypothetical protein